MKFKLDEISVTNWILLGVLIVLAVVLMLFARKKQQWNAKMLASAAICIALSFVLSYIRLFKLPQGGSVTPASLLPIIAFAYAYGAVPGLLVGFAYGLLQMIQDPYIVGVVQALLDYPLAFGCIALAGIARKLPDTYGWLVGVLLAVKLGYKGTPGKFDWKNLGVCTLRALPSLSLILSLIHI